MPDAEATPIDGGDTKSEKNQPMSEQMESEDVAEWPEDLSWSNIEKVLRLKLQADGVPYDNIEKHLGEGMV